MLFQKIVEIFFNRASITELNTIKLRMLFTVLGLLGLFPWKE